MMEEGATSVTIDAGYGRETSLKIYLNTDTPCDGCWLTPPPDAPALMICSEDSEFPSPQLCKPCVDAMFAAAGRAHAGRLKVPDGPSEPSQT